MATTGVTSRKGSAGWEVLDGEEVLAVCPKESTAERLAFLLATWKGGGSARAVTDGGRRVAPAAPAPTGGAWGGHDRPQPGRVYDLSGLAGPERVARDVTDEQRAPGAPAPQVRAEGVTAPEPADVPAAADPAAGSWGACGGVVTRRPEGGYAVAFPRRPAVAVREALKVAGFRWFPEVGEWRGVRLPERFLPAFAGGAR